MGAVVQSSTGELLGLSCYHVVGDTNNSFPHTIWQPTNPPLIQGSSPPADDNVGHVIGVDFPRTQPLPFSPVVVGLIDAAVFTLDEALTHGRSTSPKFVGQDAPAIMIDRVTATAWPEPGHEVRKRGAITRVTNGVIIAAFVTVRWTAGPSNAYIIEQAEVLGSSSNPGDVFCLDGDSGSLVLEKNVPTAVGLLWGKRGGGKVGIISAIRNVESQLGVKTPWTSP